MSIHAVASLKCSCWMQHGCIPHCVSLSSTLGLCALSGHAGGSNTATLDCCFHPDTVRMAQTNPRFRELVATSALDTVQAWFANNGQKVKVDPGTDARSSRVMHEQGRWARLTALDGLGRTGWLWCCRVQGAQGHRAQARPAADHDDQQGEEGRLEQGAAQRPPLLGPLPPSPGRQAARHHHERPARQGRDPL